MAEPLPTHRWERGAPSYPASLLDLVDPPACVHVRGSLPAGHGVAIVGSRAATGYGLEFASRLAADLAMAGVPVISGLAHGIDTAAHRGALEHDGATVAVLPGGLDPVTPAGNALLAAEVARRGALLAEWPGGAPVFRGLFIRRNRLIAALASVVVVVEAAERSGALSTALAARRLGRPLLAVPGDVSRATSRGCHHLLRVGAFVCTGLPDVLVHVGASQRTPRADTPAGGRRHQAPAGPAAAMPLGTPLASLLAALAGGPLGLEDITLRSGMSEAEVMSHLLRLEWSGAVVALPGQRWAHRAS